MDLLLEFSVFVPDASLQLVLESVIIRVARID